MTYQLYNKPYKSSSDLVSDLETKGLYICDKDKCEDFLNKVSYYRFKIYLRPFLALPNKNFKKGYWFEHGVDLYRFDEELRNFLFPVIGRIEIKLRSRLDQVITAHTDDPFWYLNDSYFNDKRGINNVRSTLAGYFHMSKADYAAHYKSKYFNGLSDNFKQLPPFWMASELTTFGTVMTIFGALKKGPFQTDPRRNELDFLAKEFGAKNLKELNNWLLALRDIRNRCAHHSRVWNCNCRNPSSIVTFLSPKFQPPRDNRLYLFLALLHHISNSFNLKLEVKKNIHDLIHHYPSVKKHLKSAGFPPNWHFDPFWK